MKPIFLALLTCFSVSGFPQSVANKQNKDGLRFEENRGQVKDQNWQPRADVLFSGSTQGIDFHIRANGLSYQLSRIDSYRTIADYGKQRSGPAGPAHGEMRIPASITSHRIDIDWVGANAAPSITTAGELPGYNTYYNVPENSAPALLVKSYGTVNFTNVWSGVDLEYHARNGVLESDWTVHDPSDHTKIKFTVSGAELSVDEAGYLIMTTPLGSIREGELIATQNGQKRRVQWVVNGKTVSISASGLDANVPLIIDPPTRIWGTYFGGTGVEFPWSVENDGAGGVYVAGITSSSANIATTGAHQVTLNGQLDAFLSHFDGNGYPLWSTYYGGLDDDFGRDCSVSSITGDIYFSGATISGFGIATPGAHQENPCGTLDAFLVKFNAAGIRSWGTYFCGTDIEEGNSCSVDQLGNVYMAGWTSSEDSIATAGSLQPVQASPNVFDGFLVKFDTLGTLQWGTYVGGPEEDRAYDCVVDGLGNVYLSGFTRGLAASATLGGHQPSFGGYEDAFLQKYASNGSLIWGTYYGGPDLDTWGHCAVDEDHVYLAGTTLSDSGIATPGAYQETATSAGNFDDDAFVVQFDHNGVRNWATYLGGAGGESVNAIATDGNGSVLITGWSTSTSGIASTGSHDTTQSGEDDGFLAKFTSTGALHWATYYGGTMNDIGKSCTAMGGDVVYLLGNTYSATTIATPGAYDTANDGGPNDGYLVKFDGCDRLPIDVLPNELNHCGRRAVMLTESGGFNCSWSPPQWLTSTVGISVIAAPFESITYLARNIDTNGCAAVDSVLITVTNIDTAVVVSGSSLTAVQEGASYQWFNCDSLLAIPGETGGTYEAIINGTYAVAIQLNGCIDTSSCVVITNVGLLEQSAGSMFRIAPNPTSSELRLDLQQYMGRSAEIRIYDELGKVRVNTRINNISSEPNRLDVNMLAAGVYVIKVIIEGQAPMSQCLVVNK